LRRFRRNERPDSKRRAQARICPTEAIDIQVRQNPDVSLTTSDRCALKLRDIDSNVTSPAAFSATCEAMNERGLPDNDAER
jgi:hypothetical protein